MAEDNSTIEESQKQFIDLIVKKNIVWTLESIDGFVRSSSNHFEDVEVILFWSDEESVKALAQGDWDKYQPKSIPLSEFIEKLVGMESGGFLVGINWDSKLLGIEIEPLDLALKLGESAMKAGTQINLKKYKDLQDFLNQVRATLDK